MQKRDKLKDLEKEVPKKDFIDRYGKEEGESGNLLCNFDEDKERKS